MIALYGKERKRIVLYAYLTDTMLGMTWEEIEKAAKNQAIVLLPVGVVEAHGPHLPLGTDIYMATAQALDIKKHLEERQIPCIIAPPFYWGGTQAMTRQFPGTFTASLTTIVAAMRDILHSLDKFGFVKTVLLNAHGDDLHKKAMKEAIMISNTELAMKTYWPVYEDDIEYEGFTGEEDYLALIPPFAFEQVFQIEQTLVDQFDVHAGAFETSMMQEMMPELIRYEKIEGLEATMLEGEKITLWNDGEKENKNLVPKGYVGDPASYKYIKTNLKTVNKAFAEGLAKFLGYSN